MREMHVYGQPGLVFGVRGLGCQILLHSDEGVCLLI